MKSIELVSTVGMSHEDWLRFRKRGIGASEMGIIMGLSPYKSPIQLFYEKLGHELEYSTESLASFLGKEQEPFLSQLWEYWDPENPSQQVMIQNYREKRKIRRCQRINAYAINPEYDWLFASLDRKINKHNGRGNGALELKTIGGYEADKWEGGVPPGYIIQTQTQIIVSGYDYAEMAIMRDNREFDVLPIEKNENICQTIIHMSKEFWDKVQEGRKLMTQKFEAQRNFNYKLITEIEHEISNLEPPVDNSNSYANFLKEKFKLATPGERIGSLELLDLARTQISISERLKEIEGEKNLVENKLKKNFVDQNCDKFTFGDNGFISWKKDTSGNRRLLNKVKLDNGSNY